MKIVDLVETQLDYTVKKRKLLADARIALRNHDLVTSLELIKSLLDLGFPRQGATAFFDRHQRLVKQIALSNLSNDLVILYNVTSDLAGVMNLNWPWLFKLRQTLKQTLER